MTRPFTDHEKRTIRLGTAAVVIYLSLYFGVSGWKKLEARRVGYQARMAEAKAMRQEIAPYEEKAQVVQKLMEDYHMDPARLKRASLVADASAAIQKAAADAKVGVGPIREAPGRPSSKEVASIQFEGTGQIPAVMGLLRSLERVGFPLVIDSLQFTADPHNPMAIKVSMTIVVLDYEAWKKKEEKSNA